MRIGMAPRRFGNGLIVPLRVAVVSLLWTHALFGQRASAVPGVRLAVSGDAYVREWRNGPDRQWRIGTAQVEKRIQLQAGRLTLVSFRDRVRGQEFVQGRSDVLEFGWNDTVVTGHAGGWSLDRVTTRRLKQGELLLQLALRRTGVAVVKSYLLYPKESIIQEWLQITNRSSRPAMLTDPAALTMSILHRQVPAVDLTYMTGDNNGQPGRFFMHTVALADSGMTFTGTASVEYSPIHIYQNRDTKLGVFMGWDYLGVWRATGGPAGGSPLRITFQLAGYRRPLPPGDSVETPKAFTGVFRGDFDDMGHQLLDYQYRYKWDYTRPAYFPSTEMEGNWMAGSHWGSTYDPVSTYRKVFHMADVLRTVGGDTYWRDNGWWDNEGDWNGPNWAETRRYLQHYGMQQIIYLPVYDAVPESKVAQEHPEWIGGMGVVAPQLDQARPEVIAWELQTLESKRRQWGDFQWRKDWDPLTIGKDSSVALAQEQGYRRLVQTFLDRNPGMAYHGCNGGGKDLGYEMLRMGVSWSMEDGFSDHYRAYYSSYIYPPDKLENLPDAYKPDEYSKEAWRGLLWNRFPMMGETEDPAKLEGIRQLFEIYHYLTKAGVVGRWGWVYHPQVQGDSAYWYLERLSGDHRRGVIIPAHAQKRPITIYPKGLRPEVRYHISYQESPRTEWRSGRALMTQGITLSSMPDGELIYLNLPLHPGGTADRTPPRPPGRMRQQIRSHMDYDGVALRWQPGQDDNWISYYEIYRNGALIARVAKGTYYFDHALGADLAARYEVAAVDGSGNRSARVAAGGAAGVAALVVDDTSAALTYTGNWEHQAGQWSVAHGTQTRSRAAGDAVSFRFSGSRISWYGRMGPDKGVAAVYLDGKLDRVVNTHSADEMANIMLYSRMFPAVEPHTIKIVAQGAEPLVIDGLQVDQTVSAVVPAHATGRVRYRGSGWHRAPAADGQWAVSSRAGDEAEHSFVGRGITWVGSRCAACGMADVYLDDTLVTSVDTYLQPVPRDSIASDSAMHNIPLFTQRWARARRHTLKIVVRPDANVWAGGRMIYLDRLYVVP